MAKKTVHISLEELKEMITEQAKAIMEAYAPYTRVYTPGEHTDLTDEEYETIENTMEPEYTVTFYTSGNGNDNWNDPYELMAEPDKADVNTVEEAIGSIQDDILREKINDEFQTWLSQAQPNDEPYDPDTYDMYRDSMYEDIQRCLKETIIEAYESNNPKEQRFVIQTRTGSYLMDIRSTKCGDDGKCLVSALVGRTPVVIRTDSECFRNMVSGGPACDAEYISRMEGKPSTAVSKCVISLYRD